MIYGTQPIIVVIFVALYLMISSCMAAPEQQYVQQPEQEAVEIEHIADVGRHSKVYAFDHNGHTCLVVVGEAHSGFSSTALNTQCYLISDTANSDLESEN